MHSEVFLEAGCLFQQEGSPSWGQQLQQSVSSKVSKGVQVQHPLLCLYARIHQVLTVLVVTFIPTCRSISPTWVAMGASASCQSLCGLQGKLHHHQISNSSHISNFLLFHAASRRPAATRQIHNPAMGKNMQQPAGIPSLILEPATADAAGQPQQRLTGRWHHSNCGRCCLTCPPARQEASRLILHPASWGGK